MSHIVSAQTIVKSLAALKAAVKDLGGEWLEGERSYVWWGRYLGDSPLPVEDGRTLDVSELGTCDHAIKFPGCKYTVGVVKSQHGGYRLRMDYWPSGGLTGFLGQKAEKLQQRYNVRAAQESARKQGYRVIEHVEANGDVRLRLVK